MKNFYLKIIIFLLIILATYLSVERYYSYTQNKNFTIINQRHSVIIQLPNTGYIEIVGRNDHITSDTVNEKPFSTNTKLIKNSNLENSIARTNTHTEYIENDENIRSLSLTPLSNEHIKVEIDTDTKYTYQENLYYNIQLDYTNKVDFKIEGNRVEYSDKGCNVIVEGQNLQYKISENSQSVILSKKYEPKISFIFNLNIECNK
ncbi:MAG: hypothetical protein RBT33_02395 [Candidatus Dojkabacteria bacterium]|jgi:hypothetical protein|nr:hypothetical protein [Candidatus Dojkabacteria bacterium]